MIINGQKTTSVSIGVRAGTRITQDERRAALGLPVSKPETEQVILSYEEAVAQRNNQVRRSSPTP